MSTGIATLSGAQTTISADALAELQMMLRGVAEPGAGSARAAFNAMGIDDPALTVTCSGTADVVDAISFARERGLLVAIRGGGHSVAGLSKVDGGMLIDLSPMNGVIVDPRTRTATVQGGALWADVDRETQAFGLAAPGGVVSDTGVAGLTLGGGYGWLRRMHGLSCDSLLAGPGGFAGGAVPPPPPGGNPGPFLGIRRG